MNKSIGNDNMAQISTFLGIDFGRSKIGLSIADEETRMAFVFGTLKNDKDLKKNLGEIIKKKNVARIIVGITRHEKDSKSGEEKIEFGKELENDFQIQVEFADEMFTTRMAHENIKMRGGKNIAKFDDQEAARIILQSWLDSADM